MPKFYWNIAQGTSEWYAKRSGIPSASMFDHILTPGKMLISEKRKKYACRLIAERLLNWQADSLDKIEHIANGRANEPFAVAQLEEIYEIETKPIGHVTTNDGRFGASPDRVADVRADGEAVGMTVEVKCPTLPVQFERLIFGQPEAYKCQVQGQMWVAEADKSIFYSYTDRTPAYKLEIGRDEKFLSKLVPALEQFSDELEAWTEQVKRLGSFQAFAKMLLPADVAHSAYTDDEGAMSKGDMAWMA
jgi:hypothetical protein